MKWRTDDKNDLRALFYYNKKDPKVFVYKHPKHKWMGASLNLAHPKAWRFLLCICLPFLLGPQVTFGLLLLAMHMQPDWLIKIYLDYPSLLPISFVFPFAAYAISLAIYTFRMAAKDAKNHPTP